jgi:hypothetical protein
MHNNEVDLLFPARAIEPLRKLRGERWESLIDSLSDLDPENSARVAFVLFMVKLSGCTGCQSDSFRAMRGCVICSSNTIKRYKGSDQNLIDLYNDARRDIIEYMKEV